MKIAILGGGIGAISAAFELTQTPEDRAKHQITLYQMGWRLGGKGASGRNMAHGARIEEHGVHVWGGYYENAFALMRRCYAELDRPEGAPMRTWTDAFKRKSHLTLWERTPSGPRLWNVELPQNSAVPGDGRVRPEAQDYLQLLFRAAQNRGQLLESLKRAGLLQELFSVHLRGILVDNLMRRGLEAADDEAWIDWMRRHGASRRLLESAFVRGIHDLVFAYEGGDTKRPSLSAGRVIYTFIRFAFAYKGALFWEMQAGMGEVVFAPYYEVLRRRGVRFRFFHRVDQLALSEDGARVAQVKLLQQARPRKEQYAPLIDVDGLPCWPSAPLLEQLTSSERLRGLDLEDPKLQPPGSAERTLRLGEDFDSVVLGISLGALPSICAQLVAHSPRWRRMIEQVPTVATQAAQLWIKQDTAALGWQAPRTILSAGPQPLNTWADMSHLLPQERWQKGQVGSIAYLCGPMKTPLGTTMSDALARLEQTTNTWRDQHAAALWPRRAHEVDRYLKANIHPSDRYVTTPPGSLRCRLGAADSGFENLYLAGDWVKTSYNLGTIEAATIAGRQAAQAILGRSVGVIGEPE